MSETELSLSGVAHLNQGVFLLVEENLHPLDVAVDACKTQQRQVVTRGGPLVSHTHTHTS